MLGENSAMSKTKSASSREFKYDFYFYSGLFSEFIPF